MYKVKLSSDVWSETIFDLEKWDQDNLTQLATLKPVIEILKENDKWIQNDIDKLLIYLKQMTQ